MVGRVFNLTANDKQKARRAVELGNYLRTDEMRYRFIYHTMIVEHWMHERPISIHESGSLAGRGNVVRSVHSRTGQISGDRIRLSRLIFGDFGLSKFSMHLHTFIM